MQLEYVPRTRNFILRVPRSSGIDIQQLMTEYGLDFSDPLSRQGEAVLYTGTKYAAAPFAMFADAQAYAEMRSMLAEINASWVGDSDAHIRVPDDKQLWPFQRASVAYALRRKNTLVGDQPGLGKTEIAIAFANEIKAKRVLVICPANIRHQWCARIREWSTMDHGFLIHPILNGKRGVNPGANWTVVSYDLARSVSIGTQLSCQHWDLVILDEAHYLKTPDSLRTRAIFGGGGKRHFDPINDRAARIVALTGTPLPNRPREAYTLARALNFDAIDWMSEEQFKRRFNPSLLIEGTREDGSTFKRIDERSGRAAELQARLRSHFMVRHLKRDVMPQLQLPAYDLIQLEETAAIRAALHAESLLEIDPEMLQGANAAVLGDVATVRRLMGVAMAPEIARYVDMLIDGGEEKLVVFAWHHEVMDILEAAWQHHGIVRIDGSTTSLQREKRKHTFINDPRCQIFLGQMASVGIGTDGLQTVASHGLIAEPDWTPGVNIQAFDRLDRGGQRQKVQGDIFVVPGSFAERVLASALRKLAVTNAALDKQPEFA